MSERVDDLSANRLYAIIGKFIGENLVPEVDSILISKPIKHSRSSANHLLILTINEGRLVALKRCYDSPDFMRRELVMAEARLLMAFPDYSVKLEHGLNLRCEGSNESCTMIRGWEDKDYLIIDFGSLGDRVDLAQLDYSLIRNREPFICQLGQWAAFNYLFVVRDRHPGNFLYEKSTGVVLSIDNEEGPFDSSGRILMPQDIVLQMKPLINKILSLGDSDRLVSSFKSGFEMGWHLVAERLNELAHLTPNEIALTRVLLEQDALSVSKSFID